MGTLQADVPGSSFKKGLRITAENIEEVGRAIGRTPQMREILDKHTPAEIARAVETLSKQIGGGGALGRKLAEGFTKGWWTKKEPSTSEILDVIGGELPDHRFFGSAGGSEHTVSVHRVKQVGEDGHVIADVLGELPAGALTKGKKLGTVTKGTGAVKAGSEVFSIDEDELRKSSPAMALVRDLERAGVKGNEDLNIVGRVPEDENGRIERPEWAAHPSDPREIVVLGYLSVIANALTQGLNMRAYCNGASMDYPDCAMAYPIIDASVATFAEHFEKSHTGPLKTKEKRDLADMMVKYMGSMFLKKLKTARIFQFKERDFFRLYHLSDVSATTACGYKWSAPNEPPVPEEEAKKVTEYIVREGFKMPFPEKLPFESCYFAWGAGVQPSYVQRFQYGLSEKGFALVVATLLSDDGWVFTICLKGNTDTELMAYRRDGSIVGGAEHIVILERIGEAKNKEHGHAHIMTGNKRVDEIGMVIEKESQLLTPGWVLPYSFMPWIVASVVTAIEANDSLRIANPALLSERTKFKALSKRTKQQFLPRPYYTVIIQPTTFEEMETRIKSQPRQWTHQWDVMGHYGHKIMRGTLPLDAKYLHRLHKRGYEVFHAMHRPTSEVLAFMMRKRVIPPRENEWVAYLKFHRDAYVKGPKDKPYIPSVRKLKGGVPEVV